MTDLDLLGKSYNDAKKIAQTERVPAYIYKQGSVHIVTTTSPATHHLPSGPQGYGVDW